MKKKSDLISAFASILAVLLSFFAMTVLSDAGNADKNRLGPQSTIARGEQRVLVIAVRFPDVQPSFSLENIRKRAVAGLDKYLREQSYELAWLKADFRGWVNLPDPIAEYKVSPYNYKVDRNKVRKLIEDAMTGLGKEVDFSRYQHILIIPGSHTMPGKGYGMLCYCANPGMLTGVKGKLAYSTVSSKSGKEFKGGIFVGAENAHLGMFAHDFFHALGGIHNGRRLAPCLYDYDKQSDDSQSPSPDHHAIYMGPWDIMSEHFVTQGEPPPGISSFTKIRLGWISDEQVTFAVPGKDAYAFLSPLSKGGDRLVVKVPMGDGTYYLIENRQPIGYDKNLPASGIVVLKVNPELQEGHGIVDLMDANPSSPHFSQAAFNLSEGNNSIFRDRRNDIAILPLWREGEQSGVLVTTIDKSDDALKAALAIEQFLSLDARSGGRGKQSMKESIEAFKRFDFAASYLISQKAMKD